MLIVVTGGSGSGKSEYAEGIAVKHKLNNPMYYVATMKSFSDEDDIRVNRHRELRKGKGFITIEQPVNISEINIEEGAVVLLECMSNLLANEMFTPNHNVHLSEVEISEKIISGIENLYVRCQHLIIVTNEVFSDGKVHDQGTMKYINQLGFINRELSKNADKVYEVVYGLPICIYEKEKLCQ